MGLADWIASAVSLLGFGVLVVRLAPDVRRKQAPKVRADSSLKFRDLLVSVIVPARNEEANLERLLSSLVKIENIQIEIIVVDDESSDRTAEIAKAFAQAHTYVKLVAGMPRPEFWTGKNWACHQGFLKAQGQFLLFTDADTEHLPDSLELALSSLRNRRLDLLSAVPYHRCEKFWEKVLGPFQLMTLISTAAFSTPQPKRLFAIGQYLLFTREGYLRQGGHERISRMLCDDLELAIECMAFDGRYAVIEPKVFEVRMFSRFSDFLRGWRRIFRLGFKRSNFIAGVEIYLVIALLTSSMRFFSASLPAVLLMLAGAAYLGWLQKRFGSFSILGAVLFPWSLAVFITITLLAIYDSIQGRAYHWRDRSYEITAD
jgi:cellulose synthase/poly-beta-1,6-N-acetylglucosamine synthase-like glycosyltransferase